MDSNPVGCWFWEFKSHKDLFYFYAIFYVYFTVTVTLLALSLCESSISHCTPTILSLAYRFSDN